MKRIAFAAVGAFGLLLGGAVAPAAAQPPAGPVNPPAVSPYLNLFRQGSSPAINYYGLVRPQFEFRRDVQRLQQQVTAEQPPAVPAEEATALPPTGHTAQFNTQWRYFMTRGAQAPAGPAPAAATPFRPAVVPPPARAPRPPGT
jgi:hypothetical protein